MRSILWPIFASAAAMVRAPTAFPLMRRIRRLAAAGLALALTAPCFAEEPVVRFAKAVETGDLATVEKMLSEKFDPNTRIPDDPLDRTPLFVAVRNDRVAIAKALLAARADPTIEDENGDPVMVYASDHGKEAVARLLIEHGVSIDSRNRAGITPLLRGAPYEKAPDVRAKLALGADPDLTDRNGNTALMIAAGAGNTEALKVLADAGAALDIRNVGGKTALMWLVERYQSDDDSDKTPEAVRILLDAGASVDLQDHAGRTALMLAMENWSLKPEVIGLLLDAKPDIRIRDKDGRDALFAAVLRGGLDACVDVLLERGADPKTTDNHSVDLLMLAASNGDAALIRRLLDLGLSPKLNPGRRDNAIHSAARRRFIGYGTSPEKPEEFDKASIATLRLLHSEGASLTAALEDGTTPLHSAAAAGSVAVVEFLLPHFPDPDVRDSSGATPLFLAAHHGSYAALESLLAAGADIDAADKQGRTALSAAVEDEDTGRIRFLLENGANLSKLADPEGHLLRAARRFHDKPTKPEDYAFMVRLFAPLAEDIGSRDADGMTALMWTAASDNQDALAAVLAGKPDPDATSPDGRTALMWAASARATRTMAALKKAGADEKLRDASGRNAAGWLKWANAGFHPPNPPAAPGGTPPLPERIRRSRQTALNQYLKKKAWHPEDRIAGLPPLHLAAGLGDTDALRALLKLGADIAQRSDDGSTPLILAAANGRTAAVDFLLEHGADIASKDISDERALDIAVALRHFDTARFLLGCDGALGENETRLLVAVVQTRDAVLLRDILAAGASVPQPGSPDYDTHPDPFGNRRDWRVQGPLAAAARQPDPRMLEILHGFPKASGASDPEQLAIAAQHAAAAGRLETLKYLVETMGANPDTLLSDSFGGVTCIAVGDPDKNATPARQPVEGYTPLSRALEEGHGDVVRYLVGRGVAVTGRTRGGEPPLAFAVDHRQHDLLRLFLEHGAPTELVDLSGQTALHRAAESDDSTAIRLLLEHGAAPKAKDKQSLTPLDIARKHHSKDAINLLVPVSR